MKAVWFRIVCFADEPETRDAWWEEIRQEIKSHARALGCHAVVGYSESTSIWYVLRKHTEKWCTLIPSLVQNTWILVISLFVSCSHCAFLFFSFHFSHWLKTARRCVFCPHLAQQPSWILGTCVKAAWTSAAPTTGWFLFFSYCSAQSLGQSECQSSRVYDNAPFWFLLFSRFEEPSPPNCGFCHIPYDELNMPFPAQLTYCYHCRRQKVSNTVNFFLG